MMVIKIFSFIFMEEYMLKFDLKFLVTVLGFCISSSVFAEESHASCTHDSSILEISSDKFLLNPEHLSFNEGKIYLNTDTQGWIHLHEVSFDGQNYFCGSRVLGAAFICTNCNWRFNKMPDKCPNCGNTEFYLSDMYPDKS